MRVSDLTRRGLLAGLLATSGMASAQGFRLWRTPGFRAGFQFLSSAPVTLSTFRSAVAAAKAGTAGPLVINMIGDSTIAGSGGGTPAATGYTNNGRAGSIPQKLSEAFAAIGLAKNGADIFGFNVPQQTLTAADYAGFNTAVTPGSWGYVNSSQWQSLGNSIWAATSNSSGGFVWTAEGRPFDTLVIYSGAYSSGGVMKVLIDGVDKGNISCSAGSISVVRAAYTVSVGTHSVELRWVSGGQAIMIGMETIDSTSKASVRIRNIGGGSARSTAIASNQNGWDWRPALAALDAASLHIIEGGMINDWRGGVAPAATATNCGTIATAAQTKGGDVLFLGATRQDPASGGYSAATQQATVDAVAALANGTTRLFYDLKTGVGDYAAMSAAGRMADQLHPNAAGYTAQAAAVYGFLGL